MDHQQRHEEEEKFVCPQYCTSLTKVELDMVEGVKGCSVCGKQHRGNDKYSREEVNSAAAELKAKHPTALLTVVNLAFITNLCTDNEAGDVEDPIEEWAQDNSGCESADDSDFS